MTITQSTITNNQGDFSFGLTDESHLLIANSILWNEESDHEITSLPNNSIIDANIFYSDIRLLEGQNNIESISLNPGFTDVNNYDFTLTSTSPCIDSGTNFLILNEETIINMDYSEYNGNMPDMGYFEHSSNILYGDVNLDSIINIQESLNCILKAVSFTSLEVKP